MNVLLGPSLRVNLLMENRKLYYEWISFYNKFWTKMSLQELTQSIRPHIGGSFLALTCVCIQEKCSTRKYNKYIYWNEKYQPQLLYIIVRVFFFRESKDCIFARELREKWSRRSLSEKKSTVRKEACISTSQWGEHLPCWKKICVKSALDAI